MAWIGVVPMRFEIHVRHSADPEILSVLARIGAKLDLVLSTQGTIMADLTDLHAQVAANTSVIDSAIVLINGIAARIDAAGVDPAALKALSDSLKASDDALSAAVAANTPPTA